MPCFAALPDDLRGLGGAIALTLLLLMLVGDEELADLGGRRHGGGDATNLDGFLLLYAPAVVHVSPPPTTGWNACSRQATCGCAMICAARPLSSVAHKADRVRVGPGNASGG